MSNRDLLYEILDNKDFVDLLLEKNKDSELEKAIMSRKQSLRANKLYICIFGIQGAGKSSLLNALVAKDDILPVEADETTCIPVELHKSKNDQREGKIYYKDGRVEDVIVSRNELDQFVNNEFNPENKLGVDHIELYIPSDMLREDVIFVDLPGVASLREGNQETTLRYIASCTAAILLLRTIPPITRLESVLLKAVWPQVSQAFIVQNHWSGESQRELQSGIEHNKKCLEVISDECNIESDINIMTIQVKNAVKATYMNDSTLREESGITRLEGQLAGSFDTWREDTHKETALWVRNYALDIKKYYERQKADLNKEVGLALEDLKKQKEVYEGKRKEIEEKFKTLKGTAMAYEDQVKAQMKGFIEKTKGQMIDEASARISSGIYDGEYLKATIEDAIKEGQGIVVGELQFQLEDMAHNIMSEFKDIIHEALEYKDDLMGKVEIEGIGDSLKAEKTLPALMGLGGMILGDLALVALVSNPAGWVVIGVGIIGGLIGSLFGSGIKDTVQANRASKAKRIAKEEIQKSFKDLTTMVGKEINKYRNKLMNQLDNLLRVELDNTQAEFNDRINTLKFSQENKERALKDNKQKMDIIDHAISNLSQVFENWE